MSIRLFTTNKPLNILLFMTYWAYSSLLILLTYPLINGENSSIGLWLIKVLPLLSVGWSMLKQRFRAHSCLCFIILIYFVAYSVLVTSPSGSWSGSDIIGLVLSVIIFYGAMMSSRGLQRLHATPPNDNKVTEPTEESH